jgi:hypothetical protein
MQLGRAILEVLEAIPERIEVSGHEPTWKVTGGSFDAAAAFADEAFDGAVVVERHDRDRWWPRVTLTVTTDPQLAATAPPLEQLATEPEPVPRPVQPAQRARTGSVLEDMFAYQEDARLSRQRIPEQRRRQPRHHV